MKTFNPLLYCNKSISNDRKYNVLRNGVIFITNCTFADCLYYNDLFKNKEATFTYQKIE